MYVVDVDMSDSDLNVFNKFWFANLARSSSVHSNSSSSIKAAKISGYLETSSRPIGRESIPLKSPPRPTWSTPATRLI